MPPKPRTLAGMLHLRRHADRAYNPLKRDLATARMHGSVRWQAVRAWVPRDEPVCRECARVGLTQSAVPAAGVVRLVQIPPECAHVRAALRARKRGDGGLGRGVLLPCAQERHAAQGRARRSGGSGGTPGAGKRPS